MKKKRNSVFERKGWWLLLLLAGAALYMFSQSYRFTGEQTRVLLVQLTGMPDRLAEPVNSLMRKIAHILLFGILAVLFYRGIGARRARYAWLCTTLLAVLDEWHQSLVPDRTPSMKDVVLDSAAALLFLAAVVRIPRKRRVRTEWRDPCE